MCGICGLNGLLTAASYLPGSNLLHTRFRLGDLEPLLHR
jgi:hypothetical protein